jgi:Protein of unknown function (DUF3305)
MVVDTTSLDRSDALHKVGPIPTFIFFEQDVLGASGWKLVEIAPQPASQTDGVSAAKSINPVVCCELDLWLHRDEGEGYYLNLESPEPSIFVKWRLEDKDGGSVPDAIAISVSYNEAGRWLDAGESVDRVLMPLEMLPWLAEFTQLHYEPEGKKKKRGPKPSFMSREQFSEMTRIEENRKNKGS